MKLTISDEIFESNNLEVGRSKRGWENPQKLALGGRGDCSVYSRIGLKMSIMTECILLSTCFMFSV